jgi:ferric-dicitrate binding protein FerR (iron transport regulator)
MSERPHFARLATELLERQPPPPARPPTATQRARALALMASEVRAQALHRRRRRLLGASFGGVALAAAAAVAWFGFHHASPSPKSAWARTVRGDTHLIHAGSNAPMESATLTPGDHVVTGADGRATLTLSTGTHVAVAEATDVELVSQGETQLFSLRGGEITLDVAKLAAGERFLVRTGDAEIEVRGTSFTVSIVPPDATCGDGSPTRLAVAEGVVVIRVAGNEEKIVAGDHWPHGCATASDAPAPATTTAKTIATASPATTITIAPASTTNGAPSPLAIAKPKTTSNVASPSPVGTTTAAPGSVLAAQNDLFAVATDAKQRGDVAGAIAGYERYLAKYPGSGLAESATVERMRLIAKIAPDRGAVAARAYLARYPNGFARAEAEKLAAP